MNPSGTTANQATTPPFSSATTFRLGQNTPTVHVSAYVAPGATVIGNVTLSANCSVWSGAVLRGDNEPITIGVGSNIQEGAVLHNDPGYPLVIGEGVTVGHQAMLHGCLIGDGSLIGIQAVVLNGAVIGKNCLIAAGAIVTERKTFPDGSLIMGVPAKAVRTLTQEDLEMLARGANDYVAKAAWYKAELQPVNVS